MKGVSQIRTVFVMLLFFSAASGQSPQPREASLSVGSATVSEVKGEAQFHTPQGMGMVSQRGLFLTAESTIETGKGSVLLSLQDGSQVLVKPHSRVVLKSPIQGKGYFLELILGKIMAQVQKRLGNSPSFRMGTPTAVITVRGTRFAVEVTKKNKTIVNVFDGLVAVTGVNEFEHPVLLPPGFWTEVAINHVPREPREDQSFVRRDREPAGDGSGEDSAFGAWRGAEREGRGSQSGDQQDKTSKSPKSGEQEGPG